MGGGRSAVYDADLCERTESARSTLINPTPPTPAVVTVVDMIALRKFWDRQTELQRLWATPLMVLDPRSEADVVAKPNVLLMNKVGKRKGSPLAAK